ncbi:hypothetical protein [Holospora curviuscula]|uniref:Uncharacterized protein n=1 Tax=Holospora curviuscula TaxID=1082868 RepID=A0A2S5R869_9PROT|nr:hypothetical protein [Holospora curviuscula]PPE03526.1 hypothetical protein HCUR_01070 [Holospora curviuscula]
MYKSFTLLLCFSFTVSSYPSLKEVCLAHRSFIQNASDRYFKNNLLEKYNDSPKEVQALFSCFLMMLLTPKILFPL